MKTVKLNVNTNITVVIPDDATPQDLEHITNEMDYHFSFVDENGKERIIDTEITWVDYESGEGIGEFDEIPVEELEDYVEG